MGLLTPLAVRVGRIGVMPRFLPQIVAVDEALQWCSGGRVDVLRIAGLPSITMTVAGRRSGELRSATVLAAPDGVDWLVAGSYFGGPKAPAWVYNLRAAATVTVTHRGAPAEMTPRELTGSERDAAWQILLGVWPNFALYEQRTDRLIPVFRLTPPPA